MAFLEPKPDLLVISGEVVDVKFRNEDTGFTVFRLNLFKKPGTHVSCAGVMDVPPPRHSAVEVFGVFDRQSKYKGLNFKALNYNIVAGTGDTYYVTRYLMSLVDFLGEEKAYRIAKHFKGVNLGDVIESEPERLQEVEGIGEVIASNIIKAWKEGQGTRGIRIFLMRLGLNERSISKIVARHGVEYETKIAADPYLLIDDGIGFEICDKIASDLKIDPCGIERKRGYLKDQLKKSVHNGHLFLTRNELLNSFNMFNKEASRKLHEEGVTAAEVEDMLQQLHKQGYIILDGDACYDPWHYWFEAKSAHSLRGILKDPAREMFDQLDMDAFIQKFEEVIREGIPEFKLSTQQENAIRAFVDSKVMVITGPPGTGKTTILKAFVQMLNEVNARFKLLAPTGVASRRLEEAAGHPAATIHRALGYKGVSWDCNSNNKINLDAVIVDESSMVDQELLYRLLDALKTKTRLVFVGDIDQLPSVGAGYVLHALINSGVVKTVFLDQIHRQAEKSRIVLAASAIRKGDSSLREFEPGIKSDTGILSTGRDYNKAEQTICNIAEFLRDEGKRTFQVVTPRNQGPLSVEELNKELQKRLNPQTTPPRKEFQLERDVFVRERDRIMFIKNKYNLGVFNGDMGRVLKISPSEVLIKLDGCEGSTIIPIKEAKDILKLGYACTCHKVQGMEYQVVLLALVRAHGANLLQRNLVYTAITRAREKVIVIGEPGAFSTAIENDSIQQRNTKLSERIQSDENPAQVLMDIGEEAENWEGLKAILNPGEPQEDEEVDYGYEEE